MCFMHHSSWRKNVFAKQKIEAIKIDCTNVQNVRCILNFVGTSFEISAIKILIALMWARFPSGRDNFKRVVKYQTFQTSFYGCML